MSRFIQDTKVVQQSSQHVTVSSKDEIEVLADELADNYIDYFSVNVSEQKRNLEDSIEECLTHLEEVCSVLDNYRHNSSEIPDFVKEVSKKRDSLDGLFYQVDAYEQYLFETNRLLDQLDSLMRVLESHRRSGGNKIRQIINSIPKLSISGMQRFGLFNSLSGLMEENNPTIMDESLDSETSTASISEILSLVKNTEDSLISARGELDRRLRHPISIGESSRDSFPSPLESELITDDNQVDGSWQELL